MSHKRTRKRKPKGKARQELYDREEDALETAKGLQKESDHKFTVQRSMAHRDKWVILEFGAL